MGTKVQIAEEVLRLCDQQMADIGKQLGEIAAVEQIRELAGQFKAARALLSRGIELVAQGATESVVLGESSPHKSPKTVILGGAYGTDSLVAMRLSNNEIQAFLKIGHTLSGLGEVGIDLAQAKDALGLSVSGSQKKITSFVEHKLLSKSGTPPTIGGQGTRCKFHFTELGETLFNRLKQSSSGVESNGTANSVH